MGDAEVLAGQALQVFALDRFARGEADRMHQDVEAIPALAQLGEDVVDLRVLGDVQRQHDVGVALLGGILDARLELVVLVGEGEFGALTEHRFGDAAGDRTLAGDTDDQGALAGQKSHRVPPKAARTAAKGG